MAGFIAPGLDLGHPCLAPLLPSPGVGARVGRGQDMDARDKRGHDGGEAIRSHQDALDFGASASARRDRQGIAQKQRAFGSDQFARPQTIKDLIMALPYQTDFH
jgi:hypothetical protein